jgi:hypothetical protein
MLLPGLLASVAALVVAVSSQSVALGMAGGFLVGVVAGFRVVRRLVNVVHLSVDKEWLRFRRGPIPHARALREHARSIQSFAADTLETAPTFGAAPLRLWGIVARTHDGRAIPMPMGLVQGEHAAYVAERLAEVVADACRVGRAYRD